MQPGLSVLAAAQGDGGDGFQLQNPLGYLQGAATRGFVHPHPAAQIHAAPGDAEHPPQKKTPTRTGFLLI